MFVVLEFASSSAGHCKAFLERALRVLFGLLCACSIPFRKDCVLPFSVDRDCIWVAICFYMWFSCEI